MIEIDQAKSILSLLKANCEAPSALLLGYPKGFKFLFSPSCTTCLFPCTFIIYPCESGPNSNNCFDVLTLYIITANTAKKTTVPTTIPAIIPALLA